MGNVGQLGIDLLILHTAAKRCAILDSPDVLPVAGRGAFGERAGVRTTQCRDGLVTSLEVFRAEKDGVRCFFLQQRGPVVTGRCSLSSSVVFQPTSAEFPYDDRPTEQSESMGNIQSDSLMIRIAVLKHLTET